MPQRDPTNNGRQPDSNHLLQAIERSAINDDHLTDAELIEFSAGVLDKDTISMLQVHLDHCLQCQSEVSMMQAKALNWTQHRSGASVKKRLQAKPAALPRQEEPWWSRVTSWISLTPVRPLQGAYASGHDLAAVDFPVYDGVLISSVLHGSLQRRNNEYYVRVSVDSDQSAKLAGRQVEVIIADPETGQVMLQRKVQPNHLLLLGTNLNITTHQITARLLPS